MIEASTYLSSEISSKIAPSSIHGTGAQNFSSAPRAKDARWCPASNWARTSPIGGELHRQSSRFGGRRGWGCWFDWGHRVCFAVLACAVVRLSGQSRERGRLPQDHDGASARAGAIVGLDADQNVKTALDAIPDALNGLDNSLGNHSRRRRRRPSASARGGPNRTRLVKAAPTLWEVSGAPAGRRRGHRRSRPGRTPGFRFRRRRGGP